MYVLCHLQNDNADDDVDDDERIDFNVVHNSNF